MSAADGLGDVVCFVIVEHGDVTSAEHVAAGEHELREYLRYVGTLLGAEAAVELQTRAGQCSLDAAGIGQIHGYSVPDPEFAGGIGAVRQDKHLTHALLSSR